MDVQVDLSYPILTKNLKIPKEHNEVIYNFMIFNVYLVCAEIGDEKLYKIGYTRREIEVRIKEFKTGNASDFFIVDSFQSKWGTKIEARLHKAFNHKRINGEWFCLNDGDIFEFKRLCEMIHNNFEMMLEDNTYIMDRVEKGKQRIF